MAALQLELSRRTFFILVLAIAAVLAGLFVFLYVPSALVTVFPTTAERSVTQEITLSSETTTPDFVKFVLPAKVVEKELEDSTTIERTGGQVREDFAKGVVKLINEQDEEQPLLPKTHLRHEVSGVQFLTDAAVRIPPKGEIQIGVTAKVQGEAGNVPPGNFIVEKLPEPAQKVIYGRSEQAFAGGIATDSAITEAEISSAKEELKKQLQERAAGELTLAAGGGYVAPELVQIETIAEGSSAAAGSQAVSFAVQAKIRARAFVVDQNDLLSLTLLALRGNATQEEEFVSYKPDSFQPKIIQADFGRKQARVQGSLTGIFAKKIEPSVLSSEKIVGLGEKETIEYFKQFPSVGSVEVAFSPFWVTSIPARQSATKILVHSATQ